MSKGDGWASRSETGPELPQDFGGAKDHGADKLAGLVKNFDPEGSHGLFLGAEDYKVDRKNRDDVSTTTPENKPGTFAKDSE